MDSTSPADQPAPSRAELAIAELRAERADTLRAFVGLSEADTQERIDWRGAPQSVNMRLLAFTPHLIDHQQHLLRLRFARGRGITGAEYLMMKAAAAMAEFEVMCLSLGGAQLPREDQGRARGGCRGPRGRRGREVSAIGRPGSGAR